jgi:hypothetical protein
MDLQVNNNMNKKQLKRLAEKYYYGGYQITPEQRFLLENSKYAKLLSYDKGNEFEFNKLLENYTEAMGIEDETLTPEPVAKNKKFYMFQNDLGLIKDLMDMIEDKFYLGLDNFGLNKYEKIDINQLRQVIQQFVQSHIRGGTLAGEITKAANRSTVRSIMYNLRRLLVR